MIRKSIIFMITFATLTLSPLARAQDQQPSPDSAIEVIRANMRAERATIITAAMSFNDKDAAAFWPTYRKYEQERTTVDDRRVTVIKEYAEKYLNLTDADAKAMAERMLDCERRLADLKRHISRSSTRCFRRLR